MENTRPVTNLRHFVAGIVPLLIVNGCLATAMGEEIFRTWTSGRYTVDARVKAVDDVNSVQTVTLERKDNGELVEVPVQRLSANDRAYLVRYSARLRQEARENAGPSTARELKTIDRAKAIANLDAVIAGTADREKSQTLRRIRSKLENGYTKLTIGRLTEIPPEVWSITHLTELVIIECQLAELPPEIGNLTNLTKLSLANNRLSTLPAEIGRLEKLEHLDLNANQITELPPEIGELSNLEYLFVGYYALKKEAAINQLAELPPEIGKLQNLIWLDLQHNQLASLPSEITRLTKLKFLNLADNPITDDSVQHLISLPPTVEVNLERTKVTKAGTAELRKANPKIRILMEIEGFD